jgi:multiple sugar transport system permease protein
MKKRQKKILTTQEIKRAKKRKTVLKKTLSYIFLSLGGLFMLIPFLWMVSTSLKAPGDVFTYPPKWIPDYHYIVSNGEKIEVNVISKQYRLRILEGRNQNEIRTLYESDVYARDYAWWSPWKKIYFIKDDDRKVQVEILASLQKVKIKKGPRQGEILSVDGKEVKRGIRLVWENYVRTWRAIPFGRFYLNSILVAICVTVGQVFTSSLAAYAFSRLSFSGRDKLFFSYIATMMIPYSVTMIPVFILMKLMGWRDTYQALIIPAMFSAYGTFMLRQFFMTLPSDLEDAAKIDGCSFFGIYRRIIVPLSKPALATLTTFTFMGNWTSFMWPLIIIDSPEKKTLPIGLAYFQNLYTTDWTLLMAGSVMALLPIIIVFVFNQRFFIEGIRLGAIKG